jgi:hypothetical protein
LNPVSGGPASSSEREALRSITARPLDPEPGPRRNWLLIVLGGLAVAGIVYGLVERSRRGSLERERVAAAARADSLGNAVSRRDSLLAARPSVEELLAVLGASDVAAFPLAGAAGARGSVIASSDGAIVAASGLPGSPGAVYGLWHVDDAGPHHVADLGAAPEGRVLALLQDAAFMTGWGAVQIGRGSDDAREPVEVLLEYRGFLR